MKKTGVTNKLQDSRLSNSELKYYINYNLDILVLFLLLLLFMSFIWIAAKVSSAWQKFHFYDISYHHGTLYI